MRFQPTAGDVLITDQWTRTLDGSEWYLGQVTLDEDVAHIFATEENLRKLSVSKTTMFLEFRVVKLPVIYVGGKLPVTYR